VYSDEEAAALYDLVNPWGPSDDFYLALVMDAKSVLDIGCGTGSLLHRPGKPVIPEGCVASTRTLQVLT
jgi:2-polyprenyl-3-methyl-5-hydroxy-6-metoxy-1,4-benzoquinol methylase